MEVDNYLAFETRHRYRFNFGVPVVDTGVDLGSNCQGIISTSPYATTAPLSTHCKPYLTRPSPET